MRNQIEKYKGQDASSNTQRKKTVRDLEDKLTKTDKKAEDYESRYNLAVRTINQLKNGIQSIFTRIGATSASVDEMLGNQVSEFTAFCYHYFLLVHSSLCFNLQKIVIPSFCFICNANNQQ